MSERWDGRALLEPIAGESPCGQSLDESELLAFDAYRVFAQRVPLDTPLEHLEQGRTPKPLNSPEWSEIQDAARAALAKSKDLRLLAFLGAALLRTEGLSAFCQTVVTASTWLTEYWESVHPLATEDAIGRQGALSCFGDQFAVVDAIRRVPLVSSRQHGVFSLRDIEQAAGQGPIDAAFEAVPLEVLQALRQSVADAVSALKRINARMRDADPETVLSFDALSGQLAKIDRVLQTQLAKRPGAVVSGGEPSELEAGVDAGGGSRAAGVGMIKTRQDAIRALDAVAAFFQQTEPSSPVPLLLERAKRLVSKSFLEVLADIAPGALGEARVASGVKSE